MLNVAKAVVTELWIHVLFARNYHKSDTDLHIKIRIALLNIDRFLYNINLCSIYNYLLINAIIYNYY